MRMEDMVIVSIDEHIVEPPDMFKEHLPSSVEQPRIVENDEGNEVWVWDDLVSINMGLNAVVGRPKNEWGMEPARFDHLRRAAYDVDERVDDMNVNGVFAALCFGTFVRFDGKMFRIVSFRLGCALGTNSTVSSAPMSNPSPGDTRTATDSANEMAMAVVTR